MAFCTFKIQELKYLVPSSNGLFAYQCPLMKHALQLAITTNVQWSNPVMMTWSHGNAILIPVLYWRKSATRCLTVHHWRSHGIAVHHWLPRSGPVMQSFDVTFVISLNKLVGWWTRDLIYWLQVTPRAILLRYALMCCCSHVNTVYKKWLDSLMLWWGHYIITIYLISNLKIRGCDWNPVTPTDNLKPLICVLAFMTTLVW